MKQEMSDTQYGFLYKMAEGWRTRSVRVEARVWQSIDQPSEVPRMLTSRYRFTTLEAVLRRGWVRHHDLPYPLVGWNLTEAGYAALQSEQIRRGATLKGMELK